jgi:hypothetical protein
MVPFGTLPCSLPESPHPISMFVYRHECPWLDDDAFVGRRKIRSDFFLLTMLERMKYVLGRTMRIIPACVLALVLGACTSQAEKARRDAASATTSECMVRETKAVAAKPVDLDTAARAVLASCDFPGVIERPLIADYPGYRDTIHGEVQKRYDEMLDTVRGQIAVLRTR